MKRKITLCGMLICSLSVLGSGAKKIERNAFHLTLKGHGTMPELKMGEPFPYQEAQAVVNALAANRNFYKELAHQNKMRYALAIVGHQRFKNNLQTQHERTLATLTAALADNKALHDQIEQKQRNHQAAIETLIAQHGTALQEQKTELEAALAKLQAEHRAEIARLTAEDSVLTELERLKQLQQERWVSMDRRRSDRAQRSDVRQQEFEALAKMIGQLQQAVGVSQAFEEQALAEGAAQSSTLMELVQSIDARTARTENAVQAAAQASAVRRAAQASGGLAAVGRGALGALGALGVLQKLVR